MEGANSPMPVGNHFEHAIYSRADPGERVAYREFEPGASPDSAAWQDAMARLGTQLAEAGVRAIVFLHGTFLDLFGVQRLDEAGGLKRGYSRGIPGVDALLALMRDGTNGLPMFRGGQKPPFEDDDRIKQLLDDQVGDAGNYTAAYVERFKTAVNRNATRPIACSRSLWSSEHHHLGRAQAACALLGRLKTLCEELKLGPGDRLLIQGLGHAGQVLSLASNLLAPGESSSRNRLLQILTSCCQQAGPLPGRDKLVSDLGRLEAMLPAGNLLNGASLDVVTFGTPVRYGWDLSGIGKLLHIINHRPMRSDGKHWLTKMELPQMTMEFPLVWGGDYVQQLAVAGSDAVPTTPEAQAANKALWELLEPYEGFERWLECVRKCVRCANDGFCLLVDYKDAATTALHNALEHVFGHAAYTRMNAMLFNTTEIVRALYLLL